MEVLRPQLVWIGTRCYRKNPLKDNQGFNPEDEEMYEPNDEYNAYNDEICDTNLNIEETEKGYRLRMEVPNPYFKFIVGKKGETKRRLEVETRTNIVIPKPGETRDEIVINGHDKKAIISAKTRLELLVDSARRKQPFTHFLSIPVTNDTIQDGFEDFKFQVLNQCEGDRGLDSTLFQNRQKLHLTIGTLVLLNNSEIERASRLLEECKEELIDPILRGERLDVHIQGLEYMNDDPGEIDVLYAKVNPGDACDRLQVLVDRLVDKFTTAGLVQREHDYVKLHVTVMNTLFRKDPSGTEQPKPGFGASKSRESFDCSQILKKFSNFTFGPLHVSTINLSQRYSTAEDGYYAKVSSIQLPS